MPTVTGDRVVWAVLACGAIVLAAEPPTIALLRRRRGLYIPVGRSWQAGTGPRGGGAPIALGLLVAAAIAVASGVVVEGVAFGLAVGFFGLLGLVDDLRGLSAVSRLVLQASGAAWVATLVALRLPVAPLTVIAAAPAVALWLVGFVNAFDFMDRVNGMSGAHTVIGGVAYACLAGWRRDGFGVAAGLALAVGAAAFLPWNVRARVFLGSVGSYSIGAALAVLAVRLIADGVPAEAVAGPAALYLADAAWTRQRRLRRGERGERSERGERGPEERRAHVYQRWCDAGRTHLEVTLLASALTVLLCLLGVAGMLGGAAVRVTADLAGLGVLALYLRSPGSLARAGLGDVADLVGAPDIRGAEAISELEKA